MATTEMMQETAVRTKVVEAIHISKIFRRDEFEVRALDDVSIDFFEGDFVALMGPSGSGKTSLLNMIAAIDRPTHGEMRVLGEDIFAFNDQEAALWRNRVIGYIFQTFNLIPAHVETALKLVGLADRMTHLRADCSRERGTAFAVDEAEQAGTSRNSSLEDRSSAWRSRVRL
jgi:putative ABC transport system ATP-binding protein